MNLDTFLGLIYFIVTTALMYWQNCILRNQNDIMRAEAGVAVSEPTSRKFKTYWPIFAMGAVMLLTWAAVGFDYYSRHYSFGYDPAMAWNDNKPLERVYPQTFQNESVLLDGKHFIDPIFDNVTFFYQGTAGVQVDNPQFVHHQSGKFTIASTNKVVTQTLIIENVLMEAGGCKTSAIDKGPNSGIFPPAK